MKIKPDKKERNKIHIEGVRDSPKGTVKQSNRKYGVWKHQFEIPEGYIVDPAAKAGKYVNGTLVIECIKKEDDDEVYPVPTDENKN